MDKTEAGQPVVGMGYLHELDALLYGEAPPACVDVADVRGVNRQNIRKVIGDRDR